jgi:hypothetical protein
MKQQQAQAPGRSCDAPHPRPLPPRRRPSSATAALPRTLRMQRALRRRHWRQPPTTPGGLPLAQQATPMPMPMPVVSVTTVSSAANTALERAGRGGVNRGGTGWVPKQLAVAGEWPARYLNHTTVCGAGGRRGGGGGRGACTARRRGRRFRQAWQCAGALHGDTAQQCNAGFGCPGGGASCAAGV